MIRIAAVLLILALCAVAWIVRPIVVTFEPEPISFAGGGA